MQLAHAQKGMGMWGWLVILSVAGFFVMVALQLTPLYLNELKVVKVVKATADDSGNSGLTLQDLRRAMQLRWDVEDIDLIRPADIKVAPAPGGGKTLSYSYDAKAPLFYNISVVVHFENKFNMKGGGGGD